MQLAQLGYELCGRYVLYEQEKRGFAKTSRPLTTPDLLMRYARQAGNRPGRAKAMHALQWILANSWSPMETDIAILLTAPTRLGGYQIPHPQLNRRIELPADYQRRAGKTCYYLDLYWSDSATLEFNGVEDHLDRLSAGKDRTREILLGRLGIHPIVLTQYQVFRTDQFDAAVQLLCSQLHRRYRAPTEGQSQKKRELRQELFARLGPDTLIC